MVLYTGQHEAVSLLLTRVQDIEMDARNSLGVTPLMKAAIQGRTKCAKLLLLAGEYILKFFCNNVGFCFVFFWINFVRGSGTRFVGIGVSQKADEIIVLILEAEEQPCSFKNNDLGINISICCYT